MIKNLFYILTIAGAGATAYFATVTKGKLQDAIVETEDFFDKNEIVAANIDEKLGEIKVAKEEKETSESARDETEASLELETGNERKLKQSLAGLEAEVEELDASIEEIDGKVATAEAVIRSLIPNAPAGSLSVDDVVGYIEGLENERKEKEIEVEENTEIAGKLEESNNSDSSRKMNLQERLGKVKNRIAFNQVIASVSGVSSDYGFVVINRGGNNSNIDERSRLLVSRGGKLVARLKVAQVEPTQTICDIVPTSLKRGQRIRNGDQVTIEVPASN